MLASARVRLREKGVESIGIVERGADAGGTRYWNRYPGIASDLVSYGYLPLLDALDTCLLNIMQMGRRYTSLLDIESM